MNTDKKCLKFEMPKMPKMTCGILCIYISVFGVICVICG
jgi:hypothetical protein